MQPFQLTSLPFAQYLHDTFATDIISHCQVQNLWSGYGGIYRVHLHNHAPVICKHVDIQQIPKHPRGWHGHTSHQRKLSSFVNEQTFYEAHSHELPGAAKVPLSYLQHHDETQFLMVMEDLDDAGFAQRATLHKQNELFACLDWLAAFHAYFLEHHASAQLWPQGNYWHLSTRQDEFVKMPSSNLKTAAGELDRRLSNAQYKTLIHGDAKIANFCFSSDYRKVASVDFQYVGQGVGIVDVVYLLGSCLSQSQLFALTDRALDYYFGALTQALHTSHTLKNSDIDTDALCLQWRALIPLAWADFERFLQGWSPGHHKLNAYSQQQTQLALAQL